MFHTRKPRQFKYKPVFYDPKKEEMQNRVREAENLSKNDLESRLHSKFAALKYLGHTNPTHKNERSHKTIVYTLIILVIVYLLFFTETIEVMLKNFLK